MGAAPTLTIAELATTRDLDLGASDWLQITQEQVDQFAEATGDRQWIHIDPERAAKGPFGRTIAHGYLTLSLLPRLLPQLLQVSDQTMGVNYGIEKARFVSPVPVGARIRLRATFLDSEPKAGGMLNRIGVQVEIEGQEKPAMVGEVLYLAFGGPGA